MKATKGTISCPGSTGDSSVTGLTFQPKIVFFFATNQTAAGIAAHKSQMFGAAVSSTQRFVIGAFCLDNVGTSDTAQAAYKNSCISILSSTSARSVVADFVSMNSDGFTVNFSTVASGTIIHYLALGGDDITNVKIGFFDQPGSTGNQDITDPGFTPDFVMIAGNDLGSGSWNSIAARDAMQIGAGISSSARWTWYESAVDATNMAANINAANIQRTNIIKTLGSTAPVADGIADYSGGIANGFRLNWTDLAGGGPQHHAYIAMKGGSYAVGAFNASTSVNGTNDVDVGFTPAATLFCSMGKVADGSGAPINAEFNMGAADYAGNEGLIGACFTDNVLNTQCDQRTVTTKAIGSLIEGNPATVDGEADSDLTGTGGANTFRLTWTDPPAAAIQVLYVAFGPNASGQDVAVGQTSETDTAQPVAWNPKHRLVNQPSETDLAQTVTSHKTLAIGLNSETDAAQPITARKTRAIGLNTETDLAQTVAWNPKHRLINQATETDTAQATTARKTVPIGLTEQTDVAQPVTVNPQRRLINPASETDAAQTVAPLKTVSVGLATETDLAQAITARKTRAIGLNTETDTAQPITVSNALSIGLVSETDTALPIAVNPQRRLINPASETDAAQTVTSHKTKALGLTEETDFAQPVDQTGAITVPVGLTTETDLAQAITVNPQRRLVNPATETEAAQPITARKTRALGLNSETDAAQTLTARKILALGIPLETELAQALTSKKTASLGLATEVDTSLHMGAPTVRFVNMVLETDLALPLTIRIRAIPRPAQRQVSIGIDQQNRTGIGELKRTGTDEPKRTGTSVGSRVGTPIGSR